MRTIRYQAAVEYIQWAKLKDDELPPSVKREQEIINFARILFLVCIPNS